MSKTKGLASFIHGTSSWYGHVFRVTRFITLFRGSDQQSPAVLPLEFVEIGTDLHLVLGSFEQAGEDGEALGGGVDVLEEPASPAGSVEETVALDVLRLTVNLDEPRVGFRGGELKLNPRLPPCDPQTRREPLTVQDTRMEAVVSVAGSCSWTATSPSSLCTCLWSTP